MIKDKEVAVPLDKLMKEITKEINESIILVQEQCSEEEFKTYRRAAAQVMGDIFLDIMNPIYNLHPDIIPDEMKDIITEEEIEKLAISDEDTAIIQQQLFSHITNDWKKVARVVMETMFELKEKDPRWNGIPDIYYAHLIRGLVAANRISSRGNLDLMRFSEIRLAD